MSKKTKENWQGCSKHKLIQEGCIDCWCPPSKPPVMHPPCSCCQAHKHELKDLKAKVDKLIQRLTFVGFELDNK